MKYLEFIDRFITRIEGLLVVLSLTLMVSLTFVNVVLRSLYTHGQFNWAGDLLGRVYWSEPFSRQMVLWVAFLGASLLTGQGGHIRIEIPGLFKSPRPSCIRETIISTACAVICLFMVKSSISYILMEIEYSSSSLAGIPGWIFQVIIPVGFTVMLFRFTVRALKGINGIFSSEKA